MAKVDPTDDQLRAQFENTKRDVGVLFGMVCDRAAAMADRARVAAVEKFPETSGGASRFYANARDAATKNPMAAAGAAAAAGFVLARVLRR